MQKWDFCEESTVWHRSVLRWDGAWSKKQVWCPHVWIQGLQGVNVLYWRKNLRQGWSFQRSGHCAYSTLLPLLLVTPLVWHFTTCAAVKFAEPWMSNHFSESLCWEITATLVRQCVQNAPQKTGEAHLAG